MNDNDINNFLVNNDIYLSDKELDFTYNYIINNYLLLIENPSIFNLEDYKDIYSSDNYNKLNNLINEYKKKYNIK